MDLIKIINGKPTTTSLLVAEYFGKKRDSYMKLSEEQLKKGKGEDSALSIFIARRAGDNAYRQSKKGKPGYNEHGYSTFKPKSPKQQISEGVKAKKK